MGVLVSVPAMGSETQRGIVVPPATEVVLLSPAVVW